MRRVVVTGANRGLGIHFVRALLHGGARVLATCRKPGHAHELTKLALAHPGRLSVFPLDLAKPASAVELAHEIAMVSEGVDWLINNAGMLPEGERFGALDAKVMEQCIATNTVGPVMVTQALTALLERGTDARVVNLSSILGSIASRNSFSTPSYCISKAALNMATRLLSFELSARGITTFAVHPGWVRTDMGGPKAELAPEESIRGVLTVIERSTPEFAGRLFAWDGSELPW